MPARPTRAQVQATASVVQWYRDLYWGTPDDVGTPATFFDRAAVGPFAIERAAFEAGEPATLFRLLVTMAMFQRRQDQQILRILRSIDARSARELTSARRLLALVDGSPCPHVSTNARMLSECDLAKVGAPPRGSCGRRPRTPCHLKRHTELLKRYGHFGKMPTSAALALREAGFRDLRVLYEGVCARDESPAARAASLEGTIASSWRISEKIANMFLSAVAVPDLCPGLAPPWTVGIDWTRFVVVDSNVDLFLGSIGYAGSGTYVARREFIQALSQRVSDLVVVTDEHPYNPRLVQQAMYLFMSYTNRRASSRDCSLRGARACGACPRDLTGRCPLVSR